MHCLFARSKALPGMHCVEAPPPLEIFCPSVLLSSTILLATLNLARVLIARMARPEHG